MTTTPPFYQFADALTEAERLQRRGYIIRLPQYGKGGWFVEYQTIEEYLASKGDA